MKKWGKVTLVIFGAVVLTALGIDAADTLRGSSGTLLSNVIGAREGGCPEGMVAVEAIPGISCVDAYEASAHESCPTLNPQSMLESLRNVERGECSAVSEPDRVPWTFVTREQARTLCARSEKRLPSAEEWYMLTLGVGDVSSCNLRGNTLKPSGQHAECTTSYGAFDLVGNAWEWVTDDVIEGRYNNRTLPPEGYVASVDESGIPITTREEEGKLYGQDYFWADTEGAFGMLRGGYYGSGDDGGVYAVHAKTPTESANAGIGFRCIR